MAGFFAENRGYYREEFEEEYVFLLLSYASSVLFVCSTNENPPLSVSFRMVVSTLFAFINHFEVFICCAIVFISVMI